MITVYQIEGNIAEIQIEGAIAASDYDVIAPALGHILEAYDTLNVLATVETIDLLIPAVRWEGGLPAHVLSRLERVAVVSDERWADDVMESVNPVLHGKLHHFSPGQRKSALDWLGVTLN